MPASIEIRPANAADEAAWATLWSGYCAFYQVALADSVTDGTWRRICDPSSPLKAIVALRDGVAVGFANYVVHDNTWESLPVCYLEDLFIAPQARGAGAATGLIGWLKDAMARHGWSRLYWMTHRDNAVARRVYDRFTPADAFVRYVVRR